MDTCQYVIWLVSMAVLREKLLLRDPELLGPLGEVEPSSFMDVKCKNLGPSESLLHKCTAQL